MTRAKKLLLWLGGIWLAGTILLVVILGFGHKNNSFQIQNEFKLTPWVHLGIMSINRAVLYLFIAAVLTVASMAFLANRMQMRPNRVQTTVELAYSFIRDQILRGNMPDAMIRKWFPFIGSLFLFLWWSNIIGYLPLPTNSQEKFTLFGAHIPAFALYAATANISVPLALAIVVFVLFNIEGIRVQGPIGYIKSLIPAGVHGPMLLLIFPLELISTFMRLISLTVRLFANILAGHMIILFMAGGLAVILGLSFLGWAVLPAGIAIYIFELGLIASLQAFIFAVLAAIYIGGATTQH